MSEQDPLLDRIKARRDSIAAEKGILPPLESEQDEIARLKAQVAELCEALESAIEAIRRWHGLHSLAMHRAIDAEWKYYRANAPKMRLLTDALAKAREKGAPD